MGIWLAMDVFPKWDALTVGDTISFVARTIVLNNQGRHLVCPIDCPTVRVVIEGELPQTADTFSFLGVQVVTTNQFVCCRLADASHALPIAACVGDDLKLVVELCSGVGAFSSVSKLLGCHVIAGVDQNPKWEGLFKELHQEESRFLIGDIADLEIVKQLHWLGATHATILAGVSCQPYSKAGDGLGFKDVRSQSLPKALFTTWLLQSPICILECVEGIRQHPEVIRLLDSFCKTAGYHWTEKVLHLDHVWCAKRTRWFAVVSSKILGPIEIHDFPPCASFRTIQEVMPSIIQWPQNAMEQLCLSLYELVKFGDYTKGGIETCYLSLTGVLPTVLHSAGGQLYPCRCGCRQALSISRLEQRGLFCTLVPLESVVLHECVHRRHCRYLHPTEAFFLNGGSPTIDWGEDLRLSLSAVGQCASPIQAIWVLGQVVHKIHNFLGLPVFDPCLALQQHIEQIRAESVRFWPLPEPNATVHDQPTQSEVGNDLRDIEIYDRKSDSVIRFRAHASACLAEFVAAQSVLTEDVDVDMTHIDGTALLTNLSPTDLFPKKEEPCETCVPSCPCLEWNDNGNNHDEGVGAPVIPSTNLKGDSPAYSSKTSQSELALCSLDSKGLLALNSPLLMILGGLKGLREQTVSKEQRIAILENQGDLWADDELCFHLHQIAMAAPDEPKHWVWDPIVMSSMVRSGCLRPLGEYAKQFCCGQTAITAVLVEKHWYPMVWRWDHDGLHSFTCGLSFDFSLALQTLTRELCKHLGLENRPVKNRPVKFVHDNKCGALVVSFIRQLISGTAFVQSVQELASEHAVLRKAFIDQLVDVIPRPWVWGQGEEWVQKLQSLLQEHGVSLEEVPSRAQMVVDRLGSSSVSKAMQGPQPWRELKSLANQVVPMIQLIKHSELQDVIQKRAATGQSVGSKAQKSKTKGKGKGKGVQSLDPALLRVETGVFVCGNQCPMHQIDLSKVGSNASGVVLLSMQEALPYLKGGRPISKGGLLFLIVDAEESNLPNTLAHEKIRIPVICTCNGEPLLVDVLGFQLGSMQVTKQVCANSFEVVSVSSCVIKIAVYRDQIGIQWRDFIPHPLQHVFRLLPVIRPCEDSECDGSCEAWHANPTYHLSDPLLEVWGKQWMKLNFVQSSPEEAQCFTIHVRLPACILKQVQSYSGTGGLFLEPKSLDGKKPSADYFVVWLPRASFEEVQVYKRTVHGVVGLARMGSKLGLRCVTADAEMVHASVKPTSSFLPAGRKLFFLLGPVPFGTLKQSVADAVASIGWQARPIQPIPTNRQVDGVLWKLQAIVPPPKNVIVGSHGEMVITSMEQPSVQAKVGTAIVGANRTVQLCAQSSNEKRNDPLQSKTLGLRMSKPHPSRCQQKF